MSFDNLIIKRQNEHGYEKFPNRTTINTGFYRGEGTKVSENSSETILELGPVDMNVLTIAEDMKVPTDAFIGPYNVKYDIYNGDEYLFTHTKTINVIAGKTSYSFYTKLSDQTIGIGEKTRFSLIDGFSSGPNPMKNFEAIYEIPNQLTIESFGPSNENLKNVSVEA
ncbi:hypothetical protein MX850_08950 [Erysipelothrix sp. Poltava]|nr:hypothetical protein MX850_08950 [Erysipelothrix sp. Poltava]